MKIVIKLGEAMFKQEELFSCAISAFVAMATEHEIAIVHDGAGTVQEIASDLSRRGMSLGSGIPDSDLRALAAMITGHLNKEIVAAFARVGQSAAGICGSDGLSFRAREGAVNGYHEACFDELELIQTIWEKNCIPVVSNLALGSDGEYYRVEPNGLASACAIACKANSLVFLTDIAGVTDAGGNVIRWLEASGIEKYVHNSMISGSIMAKLRASRQALKCGVERVRIFPFSEVRHLPEFYFAKLEYGTDIYINPCHSRMVAQAAAR